MTKRTIFIGDVHGCIDELLELMEKLEVTPEDRVIFVGDLISKGPDTKAVVEYVHSHGYECVLGNHEQSYSFFYETNPKYRAIRSSISDDAHLWLLSLPRLIEWEDFIVIHAGLFPGVHPDAVSIEHFTRIRTWDGVGADLQNPANPPWYEFYTGEKKVIYGHWAVAGLTIREKTIGLDSRCVYGGELSAYILESNEIIQVPAKKAYKAID